MKILNFGSLNVDYVYRVPHFVAPGETLASKSMQVFAGGKGANQSMALAKAGAPVFHAGRLGRADKWLVDKLSAAGAKTKHIRMGDQSSGHAIIQVDDSGQNSIVLFAGENKRISRTEIKETIAKFSRGDILLLQNEINDIPLIIKTGRKHGLKVCLNPAPFGAEVMRYPLDLVDILVVNETEGAALSAATKPADILSKLTRRMPGSAIVLTLGKDGVMFGRDAERLAVPAKRVKAVDTTAAGDTFIGFFLASYAAGMPIVHCLKMGCAAAAISVTRHGAMDSIPSAAEVKI